MIAYDRICKFIHTHTGLIPFGPTWTHVFGIADGLCGEKLTVGWRFIKALRTWETRLSSTLILHHLLHGHEAQLLGLTFFSRSAVNDDPK